MRERSKPETEVAPTNMFQASVHPSDKVGSVTQKNRFFLTNLKTRKEKITLGGCGEKVVGYEKKQWPQQPI